MGTSVARSSAVADFSKRGASFGIPGVTVDGMDVEAVQKAGQEAFDYCRAGKGPIILEMKTYRYRGHSMSDPAKYRTKEELTEVREKRDPIENFGRKLIERGLVNEQDLKQMDAEVKRVVVEAAEFATESPEPALSELYTDIYA
jgi:pyruvate dehydrogenase E1 component alpha subunit